MAVILEFYSLIIRRDRLEALLPFGWDQYLAEYGEPYPDWVDENLIRFGAMNPFDFDGLVSHWKRRGLVLQARHDGLMVWKDMVIDASNSGLKIEDCSWLDLSVEGTASFVGARKTKRRRTVRSDWSEGLVQMTMKVCKDLLITAPEYRKEIPMKHWNDGYAMLSTDHFAKNGLVITDRSTAEESRFHYVEDMINAGWVLD